MTAGFTGTRAGLTLKQRRYIVELLRGVTEIHHGDCIGADAEVHDIAVMLGVAIVIHPPIDPKQRAWCNQSQAILVAPPKPYLDRNKDIVRSSNVLIAAPKETVEPAPGRGQGTWSTVRFARRSLVPVEIAFP